jgi:hypothetical protein
VSLRSLGRLRVAAFWIQLLRRVDMDDNDTAQTLVEMARDCR